MQGVWSPKIQEMLLSNFLIEDGKVYRRLTIENHMKVARAIYDQKPGRIYSSALPGAPGTGVPRAGERTGKGMAATSG